MTAHAVFDGDCDIAALVFGPDERPDEVLCAFANGLAARGVNVAGVIQGRNPRTQELVFFPGGRILDVSGCGCAGQPSAASWSSALVDAEAWLLRAIRRRPDLVLLNRFGAAENAGGGLLPVIAEAVAHNVPLLLPVAETRFGDWLRFTEGLAVRLGCTRASLEAWWGGLSHAARPPGQPTFCEHAK